jgi:hypothetical protein
LLRFGKEGRTVRGLFLALDRNHDGVLTPNEFRRHKKL